MNRAPEDFEKLLHRNLRDLPDRRAPRSLEARVLAEIGRRAELPWWRRSYFYWPAAMRGAFFIFAAMAALVPVTGFFHLALGPESWRLAGAFWQRFGWLGSLCVDLFRAIPPLWLSGVLAGLSLCYALLIGIAAAAYRTFYRRT